MENNKILAAILCAGILFMVTGFIAEGVIRPEKLEKNAYHVEVAAVDTGAMADAAPKELPPIATLLASASVDEGAKSFKKCAACHTPEKDGPNKVGPNLWNIVNAKHAHLDNFSYSSALKNFAGAWDYEGLNKFLHKPQKYVPGTKMAFAGLSNDQERANMILYLRSLSDNPAPLP